jgi:uncharacterized protein (DUF849 family)
MMQRKVMIACAVTGSADTPARNPAVPVTPREIAESAIDAAKAGAAIVHIHVRDPQTTRPSMDPALYREVVERIRASGTDVLINLTTGPGARFIPGVDDPLKPGPGSTLSLPTERVRHVHLLLAKRLIENGHIKPPGLFQICLGISWGQPATSEAVTYMRSLLPPDCVWFAFGISLHQFPIAAQTVLLGGHVRVGLEDNLYLEKGKLTPSNAALVEKAAKIIDILGDHVATPAEARQMLALGGR